MAKNQTRNAGGKKSPASKPKNGREIWKDGPVEIATDAIGNFEDFANMWKRSLKGADPKPYYDRAVAFKREVEG